MRGGPFSAKADHVCSQEGTFGFFFFNFFVLFFCNHCLNGKIIMVKIQVSCLLFLKKKSVLYYH